MARYDLTEEEINELKTIRLETEQLKTEEELRSYNQGRGDLTFSSKASITRKVPD